jgi:anti-anti-sigma factor
MSPGDVARSAAAEILHNSLLRNVVEGAYGRRMRPTCLPVGLEVKRADLPGCVVLELGGELDLATVDGLRRELGAAVGSGVGLLVVDLDGLGFIGVAGLRPLVLAARRMAARGGKLAVVGNQRRMFRLFTATSVHKLLELYPSVTSALAGVRQPPPRRGRLHARSMPTSPLVSAGVHAPAER